MLLKRKLINFSAWAIVAVLFVVVPVSWFWDSSEASLDDPEIAAVIEDPNDILAAGRGDAEAQRRVGEALLNHGSPGRGGVVYAVSWLQKAAEGGNVSAMVSLGKMLETGDRAPKDPAKAAMWMQMAAAAGELEGMLELGRMYRDGIGLGQDPVRAYVWLSRAGAGHNLEAIRERDELVRTLSPEKLQEAQNQSSENPAGSSAPVRSF